MKRSEINEIIREACAFFEEHRFALPPFAHWTPEEWRTKGHEADEIRANMLGWDLTDFGSGNFSKSGLTLFTIRNGNLKAAGNHKTYCEKIMIVRPRQITPMHFHWAKTEDIINRGGGNLLIELYMADEKDALGKSDVIVSTDGVERCVAAGTILSLGPGESITLTPRLYHRFWGEEGKGNVLVGEVSTVNDDTADNRIHDPIGRFPAIEEDAPPFRLLCSEYPKAA